MWPILLSHVGSGSYASASQTMKSAKLIGLYKQLINCGGLPLGRSWCFLNLICRSRALLGSNLKATRARATALLSTSGKYKSLVEQQVGLEMMRYSHGMTLTIGHQNATEVCFCSQLNSRIWHAMLLCSLYTCKYGANLSILILLCSLCMHALWCHDFLWGILWVPPKYCAIPSWAIHAYSYRQHWLKLSGSKKQKLKKVMRPLYRSMGRRELQRCRCGWGLLTCPPYLCVRMCVFRWMLSFPQIEHWLLLSLASCSYYLFLTYARGLK